MPTIGDTLIYAVIAILGVCGFFTARHIYKHKKMAKPLVCPMKFSCHEVVHSNYSKLFGIPLEVWGMTYYAIVVLGYAILLILPPFFPEGLPYPVFLALLPLIFLASAIFSFLAFIFSLYLLGVQMFVLRKGCSWCILSALISVLIFILILV